MDLPALVKDTVTVLAPALPYLYEAGKEAGSELARKIGSAAADQTVRLWNWLRPKAEATPALQTAVADLAAQPDDADAQAVMRVQLKKLLEAQPTLVGELSGMLQNSVVQSVTQTASGTGNFQSAGNMTMGNVTIGAKP